MKSWGKRESDGQSYVKKDKPKMMSSSTENSVSGEHTQHATIKNEKQISNTTPHDLGYMMGKRGEKYDVNHLKKIGITSEHIPIGSDKFHKHIKHMEEYNRGWHRGNVERNEQEKQEIPKTILEQLKQSRVGGFPFFNYTGINDYVLVGNEAVMLKNIPKNPNKITGVDIYYDRGRDAYNIYFEKGIFPRNQRVKGYKEVYVDQMAEIIVKEMGVQ